MHILVDENDLRWTSSRNRDMTYPTSPSTKNEANFDIPSTSTHVKCNPSSRLWTKYLDDVLEICSNNITSILSMRRERAEICFFFK